MADGDLPQEPTNPYQPPAAQAAAAAEQSPLVGVEFTNAMVRSYSEMGPWIRLVAAFLIVSLVLAAITIRTGGLVVLVPLALMSVFYIYPAIHLTRYSRALANGIKSGNVEEMERALSNARSVWKFIGVVSIVFCSILALAIVVGIIAGIVALIIALV